MELTDVKPSEVTFQERLCRSPHANVFLVTIRGVTCVMRAVSMSLVDADTNIN